MTREGVYRAWRLPRWLLLALAFAGFLLFTIHVMLYEMTSERRRR